MFSPFIRVSAAALALFAAFFPVSGPATAQSALAEDAKRRVDIAGRQRMLSQQIAKAACFIHTGLDVDGNRAVLNAAHTLFSQTHDALRFGNSEIGLIAEVNPDILAALAEVDIRWHSFSPLTQPLIDGRVINTDNLASLNAGANDVLQVMDIAVSKTAHTYGENLADLPLILTNTINLAGRQRMYTQQISKDFCLIHAGINVNENMASLAQTQEYFNATLQALIDGIPGFVVGAPTEEIRTKLLEVQTLWQGPDALIAGVLAGKTASFAERNAMALDGEAVISAMNQAVGMYEFVDQLP